MQLTICIFTHQETLHYIIFIFWKYDFQCVLFNVVEKNKNNSSSKLKKLKQTQAAILEMYSKCKFSFWKV